MDERKREDNPVPVHPEDARVIRSPVCTGVPSVLPLSYRNARTLPDPNLSSITVSRTAHYATLGKPGPHVKKFILACHGYGQVAEKFILDLAPLADEETFIAAPEGLSTFYWGGFDGPTVSSWMTRRNRLDEIEDYSNYLDQLFAHCLGLLQEDQDTPPAQGLPEITLFGFSQGCATIMRWVMNKFPKPVDHLLFWAGSIPEDLDYLPFLDYFEARKLTLALGTEDPFLTPERVAWHDQMLAAKQLPVRQFRFSGKHEIPSGALLECWKSQTEAAGD